MGIYIDSITMPDSCDDCPFNYDDLYCLITEGKVAFQKRRMNCPLEQVSYTRPLVLTCDGCRHVGTYDTDFPCSGCIRREKDYYEQER